MRTLFLLLCCFGTVCCYSQTTQLKLASDIWPPFTNEPPHRSFATELVEEALKRAGVTSTTEMIKFSEVMVGIEEEDYDGSAALWFNDDRKKTLLFSAPYLQNQLIVVGRKGSDVSMSSFADLNGKKVAIVGNYAYGSEVTEASEVNLVSGDNDQQNLERLLKGEVDYILVDNLLMQYMITHQKEDVLKYLEVGKVTLFKRALHFAIRKNIDGAESIIDRFNNGVLKMIMDGTYNRILELNWIRADVDGDGKMEMIGGGQVGKAEPGSSYDVWFTERTPGPTGNQYYIDGKLYKSWESVPQKYKVAPPSERPEDLKLLQFNF